MGRNAKLRKQRQEVRWTENASESGKALAKNSAKVSYLAQTFSPTPSSTQNPENRSFLARLVDRFNPFAREPAKNQVCVDAVEFFNKNTERVGAIAWEGSEKNGKGLVFIKDLGESNPEIQYISRQFLKKFMRQQKVDRQDTQAINNMIEVYEPEKNVVIAYVNRKGEMSAGLISKVEPSPSECYRMMQEVT